MHDFHLFYQLNLVEVDQYLYQKLLIVDHNHFLLYELHHQLLYLSVGLFHYHQSIQYLLQDLIQLLVHQLDELIDGNFVLILIVLLQDVRSKNKKQT
jgi:hypothetical protein